jgi:acyl carrier protein
VTAISPDSFRGRLIQALASLPTMEEAAERQIIVDASGFASLSLEIDWSGSAVTFVSRLLELLAGKGDDVPATFLGNLAARGAMGRDRKDALLSLRAEWLELGSSQRLAALIPTGRGDLRAECRRATQSEIRGLGSKFIRKLYFRRESVEDRLDEFLASTVTCFLIVSKPGRGKTNLLCFVAEREGDRRPVLFLSARMPVLDEHGLLKAIASRLGFGHDWQSCFAELAQYSGMGKPLVLLDAINESPAAPELLREALRNLLDNAERAGIKVVVTCRTDFWQFYRAPFWRGYVDQPDPLHVDRSPATMRGHDLPLFPVQQFDVVVSAYFTAFDIDGELHAEAREQCRHPLVLRLFCEAYRGNAVGVVQELRLYRLFRLFWERKVENVADVVNLKQADAVAGLVLIVAELMRRRATTSVPREEVARALAASPAELDNSASLYSRVLDEEIILEESVDQEAGMRNVVFVYDRFAEYALAICIYAMDGWQRKSAADVVSDAQKLMEQEFSFGSIRGALEFLVHRLDEYRPADGIHFRIIEAMLERDWKWRRIGTMLTFQLDPSATRTPFWEFVDSLLSDEREFVRRLVADQVVLHANRHADKVLDILARLRVDPYPSVREVALHATLRLPAPVAIRQIERLGDWRSDPADALRLLLWPLDSTSSLLQYKLRWLVTHHLDRLPPALVSAQLKDADATILDHVMAHEELVRAVRAAALPEPPTVRADLTAWVERFEALAARQLQMLDMDLLAVERVMRIFPLAQERWSDLPRSERKRMPRLADLAQFLLAEIGLSMTGDAVHQWLAWPPEAERGLFIGPHPADRRMPMLGFVMLLVEHATQPFSNSSTVFGLIKSGTMWGNEEPFYSLLAIAAGIWAKVDQSAGSRSPIDFQREFDPELLKNALAEHRLFVTPVERRGLITVGRTAVWIWLRKRALEHRRSRIEQFQAEMSTLSPQQIQDRLIAYHQDSLTQQQQQDLNDNMIAVCREFGQNPTVLAAAWLPLVGWADTRESEIADDQMAEIHRRDPDAFWQLAQVLLGHSDPRVVDLASRAIERSEHIDQVDVEEAEIIAGLAEILEEVAGVNPDDVRPSSDGDTLDIDSLSLVEVIVAVEEKYGIRIPDSEIANLRTVRDAVTFIKNALP